MQLSNGVFVECMVQEESLKQRRVSWHAKKHPFNTDFIAKKQEERGSLSKKL